jgi:hypothetical protein
MEQPHVEGFEVWDEEFNILTPANPDLLVELAVDVRELYRKNIEFGGLLIRTPQDVAIDWFPMVGNYRSLVYAN